MNRTVTALIINLFLFNLEGYSQTDTLSQVTSLRKWYVPDGAAIMYAGGFGMLSGGVVYKPSVKWETVITVGYVPPVYGNIWTTNLMTSYIPLRLKLNDSFTLHAFKTGAFVNFNFGKNIYLSWPDYYPDGYYWWNSSARIGSFMEMELKYTPQKDVFDYVFSFHCNTNDLYITSYYSNIHAIHLQDILVFGIGMKMILKKN